MGWNGFEVIDAHTHILPPEIIQRAGLYEERDEHFRNLAKSPRNRYATAEDLIQEMDRTGVSLAVTFGFAFKDPGACREVNDYVAASIARYPDRLVGFMCVNPSDPDLEGEVARCVAAGLRGIGELFPDGQGFRLDGGTGDLAALCVEAGLPLLVHVNEKVGHSYPGKGRQGAEEAYALAARNPGLRVCYAHWGGGLVFYELMPEVRRAMEAVYYDTAASPFLYDPRIYEAISVSGVQGKVMFGSDYPLLSPERYFRQFEALSLPERDMQLILSENARGFLGLK